MVHAIKFLVDAAWRIILKDLGVNQEDVLKRAGLAMDLFTRKDADLSAQEYFRLWNALEKTVDDPVFPLKLARMITTEAFSPPLFAALCSPNLNVAMARLSQFKKLVGPMALKVKKTTQQTSLTLDCLYTDLPLPQSLAAMELVFLTRLARLGTRERITPTHVSTKTELAQLQSYAAYFGRMPVKSRENRISFAHADAIKPFLTENQGMWLFFEPELRNRLSNIDHTETYVRKVRSLLFELLPSGLGTIDEVAQKLAVSRRSLQRHLKNEGTGFQAELNRTREKLARHYLAHSTLPGTQISFLLGYDDPNSFIRAFRSWTGETPEQARAAMIV